MFEVHDFTRSDGDQKIFDRPEDISATNRDRAGMDVVIARNLMVWPSVFVSLGLIYLAVTAIF